ncbi:MAG TPA: HlyD family efflux transporter periplasmic adaptor subunit [Thermoanaerobaculia bacterium]|nr:HlyD family efflux transporter periplasmic adaptor subunit [Thermoanaerobaculia bacterium]
MDKPRDPAHLKQRRQRQIVIGSIAAVVLIFGTYKVLTLERASMTVDRQTVWTGKVERGEMVRQVRGPGTLIPEEIQWITAGTVGQVDRRVVLPGSEVTPDTVILELSNPELEQQALDARLALDAARAESRDLEVRLESEVLNQQAEAARVASDYEEAKLEAEAQEQLARDGLTPEITLKRARLRAKQLGERTAIEQQRLAKQTDSVQAQLASQRARIEQFEAIYQLRQSQVNELNVRAGIAGVLQEVPVEVGQRVSPGTNLALVANPALLKAVLQIPQIQAKDLLIGQKAEVDTRNGIVSGRVKRIDPAVREGTVTVDVEILGELPKGARPDLSVEGTVEIERLTDVLFVGRPTYGNPESQVSLFKVLATGEAVRVPVMLGKSSVNTIEVRSGLDVGDEVILSDTSAFDDQEKIRLE